MRSKALGECEASAYFWAAICRLGTGRRMIGPYVLVLGMKSTVDVATAIVEGAYHGEDTTQFPLA